ncbi:unnamed protein product [Rhodiola kirilowii]
MSMTILPPRKFPKRAVASQLCPAAASPSPSSRGHFHARVGINYGSSCLKQQLVVSRRFMYTPNPEEKLSMSFSRIVCAASAASGLEASIGTDAKESDIKVKATVSVITQDEEKIELKVDVSGEETDKVFNLVLRNLASTAPPIPGFRRQKGGKTTKVPKDFLLNVLGEERVTKFVIQEIVSSTVADYVKKEGLAVKENKLNTTQTIEELQKMLSPGKEFGFNANLELEKETDDTVDLEESDIIDVTVESEV